MVMVMVMHLYSAFSMWIYSNSMISQEVDWANKSWYNFFKEVSEQEIIVTLTKTTTVMAVLQAELTSKLSFSTLK